MSASICHRCGSRVNRREFTFNVTVITVSQIRDTAFYCQECRGLLCGSCAGLAPSATESSLMIGIQGSCPVCKRAVEPALEDQLTVAMSVRLRRQAKKGFIARLIDRPSHPAESLAYLFVVTQHPEIADRKKAAEYLVAIKTLGLKGPDTSYSDTKLAAVWATDPVDRAQHIQWASEAFGEGFAAMSTKYLLSFARFEHQDGNGQVLLAHNPG